ncbi:MAG: hypothetical protein ACI910_002799 [Oleispira sp.]|jgi:hypothetical protein
MTTLLIVFIVMVLFVVFMSAGILLGGKPISGSCGGMSAVGMKGACDVCGGDFQKCDSIKDPIRQEAEDLFYDASKNIDD